jgi:hypothetical protein
MFLLRTAFWLSIVILLIPVDDEVARRHEAALVAPPIGALEAVGAAQSALDDVGGFCDRNPDVCSIGERIGTTFALKAQSGARLVAGWVDGWLGGEAGAGAGALVEGPGVGPTRGTLTHADLEPVWRGDGAPPPETTGSTGRAAGDI